MPDVDLGEATIHYEQTGEGAPAYVFCHGLGGSGEAFERDDMAWYAERFRTVSWDNRGLGRSGPAARYSLPRYAQDLAGLLDLLGIERAVVFGVSWGGVLVQRFALDHPARCAAIVIDSSSSEVNVPAAENWHLRGEIARLGLERAVIGRTNDPAFGGHVTASADPDRSLAVRPEHLASYVAQTRATAALREHPLTPYLQRIDCPALIVGAGKDAVAGAGGSVIMARAIGENARRVIFQEAGHGVYREDRAGYRALLLEFLAEHGLYSET